MNRLLLAACLCAFLAATSCAGQPSPPELSLHRPTRTEGGTWESGNWRYVLHIRNPGSRSEGSEGRLFFRQVELSAPSDLKNYYDTPLGRFRHTGIEPGRERHLWDDSGWMRIGTEQNMGGTELVWPGSE